jgi:peptidoglycan-associated lipoprotein
MRTSNLLISLVFVIGLVGCSKKPRQPATQAPAPAITPAPEPETAPPAPESYRPSTEDRLARVEESEDILSQSLENINAQSPLTDIPFDYDSAALSSRARSLLESHSRWLLRYPSVTVLIEGHCDERGTVQYNLALGERRADATYNYLVGLGISETRVKKISYGKEFPTDQGHNAAAWARNRRGHFVITSK